MGEDRDDDGDDADRRAILARRNRFIALALSGLTSAAASGCYESHTVGATRPRRDGGEEVDTGTPMPCLSRPIDAGPSVCLGAPLEDAGPTPCLDFAPEDAGADAGEVTPGPCLSAPLEDAGAAPGPCLALRPVDGGDDDPR